VGSVEDWKANGAWPDDEDPDRGFLCCNGFCPVCQGEGCPRYAEGFAQARAETLARVAREIEEDKASRVARLGPEPPQHPAARRRVSAPGSVSAWLRRWVKRWPGVRV
jgi:hypothetical protein